MVVELGADVVVLALVEGPEGASLEGGVLRWTPTRAQAREGRASFVVRASDEDGGSSEQAWEVVLRFPDGRPVTPTILAPNEGEQVQGARVVARWGVVVDPDGDALVYDLEVSGAEAWWCEESRRRGVGGRARGRKLGGGLARPHLVWNGRGGCG